MLTNRKKRTIKFSLLFFFFSLLFYSCQKGHELVGMWQVEKVQMAENEMTPIARWMQFNEDGSQTNGNGWLQHSYGTWNLTNNQLIVIDQNGINENSDPFSIEVHGEQMIWKRVEDGQEVVVTLKRIQKMPQSGGNRVKGLWKLTKATDDGNDITAMINSNQKAMLHLRWDNTYVQHHMPQGKKYGVYKIHGHKPEIQLVNYGNESKFSFWTFSFEGSKLILVSTDQKSVMEFERIEQYL
jgi:hypothetical protein